MKKIIIALTILSVLSVTVSANGNTESGKDFLFKDLKNPYLYPEMAYTNNPVALSGVRKAFILNNVGTGLNIDKVINTRIDDSIGAKGGTGTVTNLSLIPVVDLISFFPLKKFVIGFGANYESDYEKLESIFSNYNAPTETKKIVKDSNNFDAGGNFYMATRDTGKLNWGFSAGYNFRIIPKVFQWITDSSVSPSLHYVDPESYPSPVDEITHSANASIGASLPFGGMDLSLGINYLGKFNFKTDDFKAVDTDGDGYNETLMSWKDYIYRTKTGGWPSGPATGYNYENRTISTRVDLFPVIKKELSKDVTFILSGKYRAVDYTVNNYKKQITTASILKDDSWTKKVYNSSLGTFDVVTSLVLKNRKEKSELRFGIGYSRANENYSQDGDSVAGLSLYSSLNTNNYTELALGDNPENDSIINNDVYPSNTLTQKLLLTGGYQWFLLKQVFLYVNVDVTASMTAKTYDAFNLDTRTVWEESYTSSNLNWDIDPLIGLAFPIGKKIMCTMDLHRLNTTGDILLTHETAPGDIDLSRPSTNGATDLISNSKYNFEINLGFIIEW